MRKILISGLFAMLISFVGYGQSINSTDGTALYNSEFSMNVPQAQPTHWHESYDFAIRTNLVHWLGGVLNAGIEWRASQSIGIKVDGGWSGWTYRTNFHKTAYVNPEIRVYLWPAKRFYLGAAGTFGSFTTKFNPEGYEGTVTSGGLSVGYQTYLTDCFLIDFNVGIGYAEINYDTFTSPKKGQQVFTGRDKTKDWFGPNQVGVALVWKL